MVGVGINLVMVVPLVMAVGIVMPLMTVVPFVIGMGIASAPAWIWSRGGKG